MKKTYLLFASLFCFCSGFAQTIAITSITSMDNDTLCNKGDYVVINYQATGSFNPSNLFYAEISDMNGSFANPTAISYSSASMSGSLYSLYWLNGFPAGTGYRFRVVSSNPVIYGNDNGSDYVLFYPDVNVTAVPGQLEAITTDPTSSFQWMECSSSLLPGETSSTFSSGTPGMEYAVEITQQGCVDTSSCTQFIQVNSITEESNHPFTYAPNPLKENLTIYLDDAQTNAEVNVYNSTGRRVSTATYAQTQEIFVNIDGAEGLYFVEMRLASDQTYRFKVVKE